LLGGMCMPRRTGVLAALLIAVSYAGALSALATRCRVESRAGRAADKAQEYLESGDRDLAIAELRDALANGADGPVLRGLLGLCDELSERHEEAIPLLESAVEATEEAGHGQPWRVRRAERVAKDALFAAYVATGRREQARALASRESSYVGQWVRLLLARGEYDLAEDLIHRQLRGDSMNVPGWARPGLQSSWIVCAVGRGDREEALKRWRELASRADRLRMSPLQIVVEQAVAAQQVIARNPSSREADAARLAIAQGYLRLGLSSAAVQQAQQVVAGGRTPPAEALRLQADALETMGDQARAREVWRKAVAADPEDREGRWRLARSLYDASGFEEAREQLDRLLSAEPDRARAWLLMGDACRRIGDSAAAIGAYRQGIGLLVEGRGGQEDALRDTGAATPMNDLLLACRHMAEMARNTGALDDEEYAWNTVLDLANRPGRQEDDPPPDWLSERGRYRLYRLTGVAPPPLPGKDVASGGTLLTIK